MLSAPREQPRPLLRLDSFESNAKRLQAKPHGAPPAEPERLDMRRGNRGSAKRRRRSPTDIERVLKEVKKYMEKEGLSQREAADKAGVAQGNISKWLKLDLSARSKGKKARSGNFLQTVTGGELQALEKKVYKKFKKRRKDKDDNLRSDAQRFARRIRPEGFQYKKWRCTFSKAWFRGFARRFGLVRRSRTSNSHLSRDQEHALLWPAGVHLVQS